MRSFSLVFILFYAFSLSVFADEKPKHFDVANKEYNAGNYKKSVNLYIKTIQGNPKKAEAYRNLARAYFWQESYAKAVAYYDFYLNVANVSGDLEQVRRERELAKQRAGEIFYTRPKSQTLILEKLNTLLKKGHGYTKGGGRAYGMYANLLRAGFAEPKLSGLRTQLVRRLIDEFDAELLPRKGFPVPVLKREIWEIQHARLNVLKALTHDPVIIEIVNRRIHIYKAISFLLNDELQKAAVALQKAKLRNPDIQFLDWYLIGTLLESDQADKALKEISKLARKMKNQSPEDLQSLRLFRAIALQKKGRYKDAAAIFEKLLHKNASSNSTK